jgi:hypothetical protein
MKTPREKEIINALIVLGFNYLHRDEQNDLYVSVEKPQYDRPFNQWYVDGQAIYLDCLKGLFNFVGQKTKYIELKKEKK